MKAWLMFPARDFDLEQALPAQEAILTQDLALETLFAVMAQGDSFVHDVVRRAMLTSLTDPSDILYRQQVLTDCLAQPAVVRALYDLTVEAIEGERRTYGWMGDSPNTILGRAVQVLELFIGMLRRLRSIADAAAGSFHSEGFTRFFTMIQTELDDAYLGTMAQRLKELKFRGGLVVSARLGTGNIGRDYVLRDPPPATHWWQELTRANVAAFSFDIPDRDENGFRALGELRDRGVNLAANVVAQSAEHILSFFRMLRTELAFYIGSVRLFDRLTELGEPACFPTPDAVDKLVFSVQGLYDVSLALHISAPVVGNDIEADSKMLVMITGANQGGKSTFLRSVGLAQLMMQCGMFTPAQAYRANVCSGVFTHYRREEDAEMTSGKLDEELARMSEIADQIQPHGVLLCNESFAATNEREGSELARQVIRAMTESAIKVFFVTHLYDLAISLFRDQNPAFLFLRAEREEDGRRTYRLHEGKPLPTSYGVDSYRRIFGTAPEPFAGAALANTSLQPRV